MATVYTVYVAARPRPVVTKIRRRLKGLNLQRAKAALKYLNECLNADARLSASSQVVPAARLIFANDTKALATINKAVTILQDAITSTVQFQPAQ